MVAVVLNIDTDATVSTMVGPLHGVALITGAASGKKIDLIPRMIAN